MANSRSITHEPKRTQDGQNVSDRHAGITIQITEACDAEREHARPIIDLGHGVKIQSVSIRASRVGPSAIHGRKGACPVVNRGAWVIVACRGIGAAMHLNRVAWTISP